LLNQELLQHSGDKMNDSAANELHSLCSSSKHHSYTSSFTLLTTKSVDSQKHTSQPSQQGFIQTLIQSGPNPVAELKLTMAIADLVHSCGLPFCIPGHTNFRKVITLANSVGTSYRVPSRNQIASDLLDVNYNTYVKKNKEKILMDLYVFGLSFFGDGATVRKMYLVNVLFSWAYLHLAVMDICDCTSHMEVGGK
jgi:hypothetical protein